MIDRRGALTAAAIASSLLSVPASACRAPAAKDKRGYTKVTEDLFTAWWERDYNRFLAPFNHPERDEPLPDRALFDAHFDKPAARFRGQLLFNGASLVAQVITPQEADEIHGICAGHALADLFLIKFYPGLDELVIQDVQFLYIDLLASKEWRNAVRDIR